MSREKYFDVLIIGAGMAGTCLARQLRLEHPELSICIIDRKQVFDYWVGESTVEVWYDYAVRVLKLGPYLARHQLSKHGLRFFFDSQEHRLGLAEMSESGRSRYPSNIPAVQIDRSTFDTDMCKLLAESGVEVLLNTRLLGREGEPLEDFIHIDREGGHLLETTAGTLRCKWLVDAAGRNSPLARKFDLVPKDDRHPVGSYWGRFTKTRNIDDFGNDAWRERVDFTQRFLSTNHFMYRGYWIWLIPIGHDTVSIGVVFNREQHPLKMKKADDLTEFLRGHRAFEELLGPEGKCIDFMGLKHIPRCATQMYSADRWFLTGMSGVFVDALFSHGSVAIAYSNRLISELIKTDRSGDAARAARQLKHFNLFMRMRYESALRAYNYDRFGSFDVWMGWRSARQSFYWNSEVPNGHTDLAEVLRTADAHGVECDCTFEKASAMLDRSVGAVVDRLTDEFVKLLDAHHAYFDHNRGHFSEATERLSIGNKVFAKPRDLEVERREDLVTYEATYRHFLRRAAELEKLPFAEGAFQRFFKKDWSSGQTLADGLAMLRDARRLGADAPAPVEPVLEWLPKGPVEPEARSSHEWYCRSFGPGEPGPARKGEG